MDELLGGAMKGLPTGSLAVWPASWRAGGDERRAPPLAATLAWGRPSEPRARRAAGPAFPPEVVDL